MAQIESEALATLKAMPQWVCYRIETRKTGKLTKKPVNPHSGGNASTTDPRTWADYQKAAEMAEQLDLDGVGFVFTQKTGIVGVDLDDCLDEQGQLMPWAADIVRELDSYTEISPSGKGLHIFLYGNIPAGRKKGSIEMYNAGRYFTVTGHHFAGTPERIEQRQAELEASYQRAFGDKQNDSLSFVPPISNLEDAAILELARKAANGAKFQSLWQGNINGYPSQSEADQALCSILTFYTQDAGQLDRLFKQSNLYRAKWDKQHRHDGATYGAMTIEHALNGVTKTYSAKGDLAALQMAFKSSEESPSDTNAPVFIPLSYEELITLPKKEWLIQDIIGPGDLGTVYGEEGTGKTFLIIDAIFAAILGLKFAGQFEIPRPLTIAYCTGEGRQGIPQRFKAAGHWYQADEQGGLLDNLASFMNIPQLFDRQAQTYISQFITDYQAAKGDNLDLLIIDTLHNATLGSNENDTKDAGQVVAATKMARDHLGCAVFFVHHANRAGTGYRGSSAYAADMDIMLEVSGKENPRKVKCYKAKDAPKFDPLTFRLEALGDSVYTYWLNDAEAAANSALDDLDTDCLIYLNQFQGEWMTISDILQGLNMENIAKNREAVRRSLKKLTNTGGFGVEERIQDPEKKVSKSNPYQYRTQAGV